MSQACMQSLSWFDFFYPFRLRVYPPLLWRVLGKFWKRDTEKTRKFDSRAEAPRLNALRCPSELNGAPIAGSTLRCDPDKRDVRFATTGRDHREGRERQGSEGGWLGWGLNREGALNCG